MAKIKHTKTELKAQTDALKRFQRFLPMLQLKKQQLQAEIAGINSRFEEVRIAEKTLIDGLDGWVMLFSDTSFDLSSLVRITKVETDTGNIAGVSIPLFKGISTETAQLDLFETASWLDDAADLLKQSISYKAEMTVLARQRELIQEELQMTSQRVNLFEKVKIPECKENIRIIRIFLGDEQTAAVARGKIAKGRGGVVEEQLLEEEVA